MITAIVLLSVNDFSDGRKIAERLEGQTFKTPDAVLKGIKKEAKGLSDNPKGDVFVFPLTDFIDACNNQEIELEAFWTTTVNIDIESAGKMNAPHTNKNF